MSEADKMFENLGYKKYTSDDCVMYMKDLFMITFVIDNKTFIAEYKQGDYNFPKIRPFEINIQELQAINKKVEELRMDMSNKTSDKNVGSIEDDVKRCNELIKVEHANWIGISNQLAISHILAEREQDKKYIKNLELALKIINKVTDIDETKEENIALLNEVLRMLDERWEE